MKKSYILAAVFTSIVLLSAFSAEAAEGVERVGFGVTSLIDASSLDQSKLLVTTAGIKRNEIEEPLGQSRKKDTTSAALGRGTSEPRKNTSEAIRPSADRKTEVEKQDEPSGSKFGIYHTIKESVLDFFLPSRKHAPVKVDLTNVQKNGRTEGTRPTTKQPAVR